MDDLEQLSRARRQAPVNYARPVQRPGYKGFQLFGGMLVVIGVLFVALLWS